MSYRSEKIHQPHELDKVDHLVPCIGKKVAKLPDAAREQMGDNRPHPYPNDLNPFPTESKGKPHNERVEPNFRGRKE